MYQILSHVLRLLIYNCCTNSILGIQTNDWIKEHFIVSKGLSLLCLCNLNFSQERKYKFFRNPKLFGRHWNQRMDIYDENGSTMIVIITSPTEMLTLVEISIIGFLKGNRMSNLKYPRRFPIPIRETYSKARILNVKFSRYSAGRTQRIFRSDPDCWDMDPQKWQNKGPMTVRSCIKNCIKNGILNKTSECYYSSSIHIYASRLDWYEKYWLRNECHERKELVTMDHENPNLPLIFTKFPQ